MAEYKLVEVKNIIDIQPTIERMDSEGYEFVSITSNVESMDINKIYPLNGLPVVTKKYILIFKKYS